MKKLFLVLVLQSIFLLSMHAQDVSEYNYKLDNGIIVKTEHCWNHVWVQQSFAVLGASDKSPLEVNTRVLGDLITASSYKLLNNGKEVKLLSAAPGTYKLNMTFKLSGKPGTISFVIDNIILKPKTKTSLSVTIYEYQILIDEKQATLNGLSNYELLVNRCKDNTVQDIYFGLPTFYAPGQHDKSIPPAETTSKTAGKIKPGTYDLVISIGISSQTHLVWLENFVMQPDIKYKISTNLNAGGIVYSGGNKDVKAMYLYPAGTAAAQKTIPARIQNLETIDYKTVNITNCCSPGTYDVLLDFKDGSKYEWRKNIIVRTGYKTDIK
jgi:hypothetical protein